MLSSTDSISEIKLGFIGGGNMAQSLIGGLLTNGISGSKILVSDPVEACRNVVSQMGASVTADNQALVNECDIVVLATKPQVLREVIEPLQTALLSRRPLLISIVAGITSQSIDQWAGGGTALVRCMPNTPALVQEGATALYANTAVSTLQKHQAQAILQAVGFSAWVEEETELDAVTALSGSGPAYFFLLMELMIKTAENLGLKGDLAEQLALQTALGAAKMSSTSDVDVAELRRRVTSPNGTTHAAVETFLEGGLAELVEKALLAARDRSVELANELGE